MNKNVQENCVTADDSWSARYRNALCNQNLLFGSRVACEQGVAFTTTPRPLTVDSATLSEFYSVSFTVHQTL